jgi:hypothetical protein
MINAQGEFNEIIDVNPETGSLISKKTKISNNNNEHGTLIRNLDSKNNFTNPPNDYDPLEFTLCNDVKMDSNEHNVNSMINEKNKPIINNVSDNNTHILKKHNKYDDKKISKIVNEKFTNLMESYGKRKSALQNNILIILIGILFILLFNVIIKISRKL